MQFPLEEYDEDLGWMAGRSAEEVVGILRRGSVGFARCVGGGLRGAGCGVRR